MSGWSVMYDGSWQVVDLTDKRFGGQLIICDCGVDPWSEMNAKKIAATLELERALSDLLDASEGHAMSLAVKQRARNALAKAGVL